MARKSKVSTMPADVRAWLDQALIERNFSDYKELETLLKDKGFDISHAAIHRHGAKLERRLNAIKTSTEAAKLIVGATPDAADHRSEAVMSMLQTGFFDVLVDLQEAEETQDPVKKLKLLNGAAISFSMLAKSSLAQKKWADEVNSKILALEEQAKKQQGKGKKLDLETLRIVREEIYGH